MEHSYPELYIDKYREGKKGTSVEFCVEVTRKYMKHWEIHPSRFKLKRNKWKDKILHW